MKRKLDLIKGLHPGRYLERELKKRKRSKGEFALAIHEYPQTISAIINGKRGMNTSLALRIESELGLEEGFLMILQVYYDIEQEKKKYQLNNYPNLSVFRPALFWDTKIEQINWQTQKTAVITRVFQRGNFTEKKEILNYYGHDTVKRSLFKNLQG